MLETRVNMDVTFAAAMADECFPAKQIKQHGIPEDELMEFAVKGRRWNGAGSTNRCRHRSHRSGRVLVPE